MSTVQLHDIVTDADREAELGLERAPGQERFLGSMISHFEDAVADTKACPRLWSVHDGEALVGFVMISDGIPAETLAADDDIMGRTTCGDCSSTRRTRAAATARRPSMPSSPT